MLSFDILLLVLTLGAKSYATLVDSADNVHESLRSIDVSELTSIARGDIGTIEIPQLQNYSLRQRPDGLSVYDIPADGVDLSEKQYETLTGKKPSKVKRGCKNPCSCGTYKLWDLADSNWEKFLGGYKVLSSPVCGPGKVQTSFGESYSYQVTASLDPTTGIKVFQPVLEKIGFKVGFAYTWGKVQTTSYTADCNDLHPCILLFRPFIGIVKGRGRWNEYSKRGNKLCKSGYGASTEIRFTVVRDCGRGKCGADGVWDACYFVGDVAKGFCPTLGPEPKKICPKGVQPRDRSST